MTPRDSFKVAWLESCAERGLTIAETHGLVKRALARSDLVKQAAAAHLEKRANPLDWPGKALGWGVDKAMGLSPYALAGLVAAPVLAGGAGGHLLAKAREDDTDIDQAKADELLLAYRQLTEEAKQRAAAKGLRRRVPAVA